jgi:hypothetical protein
MTRKRPFFEHAIERPHRFDMEVVYSIINSHDFDISHIADSQMTMTEPGFTLVRSEIPSSAPSTFVHCLSATFSPDAQQTRRHDLEISSFAHSLTHQHIPQPPRRCGERPPLLRGLT